MADNDDSVFREIMDDVARVVLSDAGEKINEKLSKRPHMLRYGTNGSLEVDLDKGVWNDFEEGKGGGVIELLKAFKGLDQTGAVRWLIDNGYLEERDREEPKPVEVPGGDFPEFMEDKPVAVYQYFDDKGKLAYQVFKFAKTAAIRYQQRRPYTGNTWVWGLTKGEFGKPKKAKTYFRTKEGKPYDDVINVEDAVRWLYRRDEVLRAKKKGETVHLMEGEKDVETMRAWGFVATTNAGGAKYWSDQFDEDLAGCHVIIWPDNDDAGRDRAVLRAAPLLADGKTKAKSVKVMDLSLHWKDAPEKADVTDWKEKTLGTKERLLDLMKFAIEPDKPKSKFNAIQWNQVGTRKVSNNYRIHKLLSVGATSIIAGATGAGKSFMGIHIGLCLARGIDWFGHRVKEKCGVVYQAGEGGTGVEKRLIAYKQHFEVPEDERVDFVMLPSTIDLFNKDGDTAAIIDEIRIQQLQMEHPVGLFVIDTFNKASAGAEEISGKDIGIVMKNVGKIKAAFPGLTVLIVHHLNAAGTTLRGHSSLSADSDEVLIIVNDPDTGVKTLTVTKLKDDDAGEELKFSLMRVVIGQDEVQEDVSSCVVVTVSEKQAFAKQKKAEGFSVNVKEERILNLFFKARKKYGKMIDYDDPNFDPAMWGKTVVHWHDYRDFAMSQQLGSDDSDEGKAKSNEAIKRQFMRDSEQLRKFEVLSVKSPYVWWPGKPIKGFYETMPKTNIDVQAQDTMLPEMDDALAREREAFLKSEEEIPF